MSQVSTDLRETRERAREVRFEPASGISATNVQKAIEEVATQPQSITATSVVFADSPFTPTNDDNYLDVDTTGGAVTILLQPGVDRGGVPLVVKDVGGNAGNNAITLTPSAGEDIDGLATLVIDGPFGGYKLRPRTGDYTLTP